MVLEGNVTLSQLVTFFWGEIVLVWGEHCGMLGCTLTLCWLDNNSDPCFQKGEFQKVVRWSLGESHHRL